MSESFSVGEIALLQNIPASHGYLNGAEVLVTGGLRHRYWTGISTGAWCDGDAYSVRKSGEPTDWNVRPKHLRKKRPPQDWVRLCELTDLPTRLQGEIPAHV